MIHRRTLFEAVLAGVATLGVRDVSRTLSTYREARISGYVRTELSGKTFDGTSIRTPEPICAASWNIPMGSRIWIEGLEGLFRVADRGHLGWSDWIDVAVWSRAEAFEITGRRLICVYPPREEA